MMYGIYVIRDRLTVYGAPMLQPGDAAAIRSLQHVIKDPSTLYNTAPQDYGLYRLGLYDDATAGITLEPTPHLVCDVMSLLGGADHA